MIHEDFGYPVIADSGYEGGGAGGFGSGRGVGNGSGYGTGDGFWGRGRGGGNGRATVLVMERVVVLGMEEAVQAMVGGVGMALAQDMVLRVEEKVAGDVCFCIPKGPSAEIAPMLFMKRIRMRFLQFIMPNSPIS